MFLVFEVIIIVVSLSLHEIPTPITIDSYMYKLDICLKRYRTTKIFFRENIGINIPLKSPYVFFFHKV